MIEDKQASIELGSVNGSVKDSEKISEYSIEKEEQEQVEEGSWLPKDPKQAAIEIVKYTWSTILVICSLIVIVYGIYHEYCIWQFHPAALYIILIAATTLLAYVEALHYANVSVEKWDMTPYRERFPRACEVQKLVKTNKLVQRFLVGRQFFVIFVVFVIANITAFPHVPHDLFGLPPAFVTAFIQIGAPGVMYVLTIGQLIPQLYVEEFTLPFLNLYGCYAVTKLSFAAEYIGICHFSWLLFHSVSSLMFGVVHETAAEHVDHIDVDANVTREADNEAAIASEGQLQIQDIESANFSEVNLSEANINKHNAEYAAVSEEERKSNEMPLATDAVPATERRVEYDEISLTPSAAARAARLDWWDIVRYAWSTFVTLGSVLVVLVGIWHHYSVLPAPVPALYIIFVGMLTLLFYLEGLMICIVATQYWDPETFRESHPRAYKMHLLVNKPENLKRFIVGRQFFTVLTNFVIAQIAVFAEWPSAGYEPVLFFIIIRSGLVGVFITLAFAQLLPELLGARYPLMFMNMYGAFSVVVISLSIEALGIGHCAWLVYFSTRDFICGKYKHEVLKPQVIEGELK